MKRAVLTLSLIMGLCANAQATPFLTVNGACGSNSISPGAYSAAVFVNGAQNVGAECVASAPAANDLQVAYFRADPGTTIAISGTGCSGWTNQGEIGGAGSGKWVFTRVTTGTDGSCTFTPTPIGNRIYQNEVYYVHESDGNPPVYDTGCYVDRGNTSSGSSCTVTTAKNGEIILDFADHGGTENYVTVGAQTNPIIYGSNCTWFGCAMSWHGQGAAGISVPVSYVKSGAADMQLIEMAVAANNGAGGKGDAYLVTNVQPNGNGSFGSGMTLPYTGSSPNTPTFPTGSVVGATVQANVLCGSGTCGTVTPPSGWSLSGGTSDQVAPGNGAEVRSYCHNYTGVEGTQTWTFSGGTATTFFIQYAATNVPNGTCTSTTASSNGTANISYTSPSATSDGLLINGLVNNNQGQLWLSRDHYGTVWGTCQLGGTCDHENFHTDIALVHSGTFTDTYSPDFHSYASPAPTSIAFIDTLIGPVAASTAAPLWPFP